MDCEMFSIPGYSGHVEKATSHGGVPAPDRWDVQATTNSD